MAAAARNTGQAISHADPTRRRDIGAERRHERLASELFDIGELPLFHEAHQIDELVKHQQDAGRPLIVVFISPHSARVWRLRAALQG